MLSINAGIGTHGGRLTAYSGQHYEDRQPAVSARRHTGNLVTASTGASQSISSLGAANQAGGDGFLTGIIPEASNQTLRMLRDCYYNDAISGTAVDLNSTLPFGDFSLYGVPEERLAVYQSAVARLNMKSCAEQITRQYLVDGCFCSTLVFDSATTSFVDQIPYDLENLTLEQSPMVSQDPVITARVSSKFKEFLTKSGSEYDRVRKAIPPKLLAALKSGEFSLDPLSTLYLARRPFLTSEPVSYLKRVLPAYLVEKTLYRGTIFEAGRRQRANVHITAGDDSWEVTPEELSALASIFQQTDADPMGAIVVTRNSINVNEFRQGGDFWKWTDVFDTLTTIKLKALGISDAFLSSESSYSNAENALVVFMESLNAYREFFTHTVFTNKLFPLIALAKGYTKEAVKTTAGSDTSYLAIKQANDYSKLDIPKIRWHKRLVAGNDDNLFQALEKLSEKGIPVPLRLWFAGSGIEPETLLAELEDNESLQKRFDAFKDSSPDGDPSALEELSGLRPSKHWATKNYGSLSDAHTEDTKGKRHYAANQKQAHMEVNAKIVKAVAELKDRNRYKNVYRRVRGGKP